MDPAESTSTKGSISLDPLTLLDAEYERVVAQSIAVESSSQQQPVDDSKACTGDHDDSSDEMHDSTVALGYAMLPDSPSGSESSKSFKSNDDEVPQEPTLPEKQEEDSRPMDACTKESIQKAVQGLHLKPPPWAANTTISDDELLSMLASPSEKE